MCPYRSSSALPPQTIRGLRSPSPSPLPPEISPYTRFSLAKLVPGTVFPATGAQGTNEWFDYVNGSRVGGRLIDLGGGNFRYDFPDNAVTISGVGDSLDPL